PSGDPPDGTDGGIERKNGVFTHPGFTNTPPGGSPGGAGGSPAPPSVNRYSCPVFLARATGKSPEPADRNVCPTYPRFMEVESYRLNCRAAAVRNRGSLADISSFTKASADFSNASCSHTTSSFARGSVCLAAQASASSSSRSTE